MKCKYCGGEVGLEESVCPYCGKPNDQAVRHHREMASFRRRYAETEAAVVGKADHYARIVPRLLIILLLLITAVVTYAISENTYGYPEALRRSRAERNPQPIMETLDKCLEDRDYIAFSSWLTYHSIRCYNGPFEGYEDLQWTAEYYKDFVLAAECVFLHGELDEWEKENTGYELRRLCQNLERFLETEERALRNVEKEEHREALENMSSDVMEMMRVFFGLDGEKLEEFLTFSEARKTAYLEGVMQDA